MADPKKSTQKFTRDENLRKALDGESTQCPYCHKAIDSVDELACPHCGLPLRRRKRHRQMTTHGGHLAKLVVHYPGQADKEHALSAQVVTLGRNPDSNIQLDSPFVSARHAQIELTGDGHALTDLGSTNGTRVNGQLLTPGQSQILTDRDIIRLSDSRGNFIKLTYMAPTDYKWVTADRMEQSYRLKADVTRIGRGFDADIVLSHPAVSWFHAQITRQNDHYVIEDASSRDDTFLNGVQLTQARPLEQGDVIGLGPFNLIFQGDGQLSVFIAERNFKVEAIGLEKLVYGKNWLGLDNLKQAKQILRHVDICINPREFVALVGGSGSGKSTLMKALLGQSPASGGQVLVNGDNLYEHLNIYRHLIGCVPQDDIIHQDLPVRRALHYALQLRSPQPDPAGGETLIGEVLAKVGLSAHANTLVGDLSGGQRKRVSIAAELLADPWIFFLDEPTSGLDPGLEKLMMDTLRQLADEGRTIVLVTHATTHITNHCDMVAFMAAGELAYFGPPRQAMDYFGVDNFPDIYTALAQPAAPNGSRPDESNLTWGAHYRQSDLYQTCILHRRTGEVARPIIQKSVPVADTAKKQWRQFKLLAQRYLELIKADRLTLWLLLAVMPLIALLLLLITPANALVGNPAPEITAALESSGRYTVAADTQRALFLMALATALLGIFSAGYEFVKEEAIYRRERMIGLRALPYFGSKLAVLGAFMAVQLVLFLGVLAVGLNLPAAGALVWAPPEFYLTLLLTALAAIALGLFISALARSKDMVTYLILLAILAQIIFSGAIFQLSPATEPLSYLTITRWSLEALGISTDINQLNQLGQVRVVNELDTGRGVTMLIKDIPAPLDFYVNYTRQPLALVSRWIFLLAHILIWSRLALWQLRRRDKIWRK